MLHQSVFVAVFVLLWGAMADSQQVPAGTVLPIMLSDTVDSAESKSGEKLTGKLMQDVVLPSGGAIRSGAKVAGQILGSSEPKAAAGARAALRFDHLMSGGKLVPLPVSLRALASLQEVFDAQLPWNSVDDYGSSTSDWNTVQVGGAAVYRGDGSVRSAMVVIGRASDSGAVTAKLMPAPGQGCLSDSANDGREQALWVFSPWACGPYGFGDLKIARNGATPPVGTIIVVGKQVRSGAGWQRMAVAGGGIPTRTRHSSSPARLSGDAGTKLGRGARICVVDHSGQ